MSEPNNLESQEDKRKQEIFRRAASHLVSVLPNDTLEVTTPPKKDTSE